MAILPLLLSQKGRARSTNPLLRGLPLGFLSRKREKNKYLRFACAMACFGKPSLGRLPTKLDVQMHSALALSVQSDGEQMACAMHLLARVRTDIWDVMGSS